MLCQIYYLICGSEIYQKQKNVNGPSLAHCDGIVQEAMDKYWKEKSKDGKVAGEWHFCKKSVLEKLNSLEDNSVDLNKMMKQKNKLPSMN